MLALWLGEQLFLYKCYNLLALRNECVILLDMTELEREADGTIKRKTQKWVTMERPKHFEAYSTKESLAFQPWKVDLKVEIDADDLTPIDYTIFVRAQSPSNAQYMAFAAFTKWEHVDPEIEDPWPRVCTGEHNPSTAEKLTEDQWFSFWAEAQFYPHVCVGMRQNPSLFRFAKPGWNHRGGLIRPGNSSIIVPDKSSITGDVARKMKAIDAAVKKHS